MRLELHGIDIIQVEITDIQKVNRNLTQADKNQLEFFQRRISAHDYNRWKHIVEYNNRLFKKLEGSYIRVIDHYRNGVLPLKQNHVQNAGRTIGGCCVYDCGCCYRDRGLSRMPGVLMHCRRSCCCCSDGNGGRWRCVVNRRRQKREVDSS